MSSQESQDRRAHPRLYLKAFGFEHSCTLRGDALSPHPARLVDISRGGARCRLEGSAAAYAVGQRLILDSGLSVRNFRLQGLTCEVRWVNGPELGLCFVPELDVGISELQRMLAT